jgi:molybdopterin molybdotransferase
MSWRELGHDLEPLEEVREEMLSHIAPLGDELCRLDVAHGRVLRQALVARDLLPPFDNSAMDGYAVRVSDLAEAREERPVALRVERTLQAGAAPGEPLPAGAAARIMTGAPLPPGAEAVVPHELTRPGGGAVLFFQPVRRGQNIRPAGGDLRPGAIPLGPGVLLRAPQLAIAAALGYGELRVSRVPRVAVLCPGDELIEAGEPLAPGKIRNSNAYSLAGGLRESGAEPIPLGIIPDRKEAVLAAIRRGLELGADALVSTGGVSAGDYDFVQAVVRESASPGRVFKVAMRPGKPQVFGLFGGRPLFGLPGNPAASIISFEVFVRPALRKLSGRASILPQRFGVRFPFPYRYKAGRVFLLRTRIEPDPGPGGGFQVAPAGDQDSSFLGSLASANAIIELPGDRDHIEPGEVHPAFWLGEI